MGGMALYLYVHLFGDFGTRGLPGTFKIFLVDVIVQMARSELVLTLPLAVYVDDSGLTQPPPEYLRLSLASDRMTGATTK